MHVWPRRSYSGWVAVVPQRRAFAAIAADPNVSVAPVVNVEDGLHITLVQDAVGTYRKVSADLVMTLLAPLLPPPFHPTDVYEAHLYPSWVGIAAYDQSRTVRVQIEICPASGTATVQALPMSANITWR